MVHALNEIRRLLRPAGILIDLRPPLDRWPVEVSWRDGSREIGRSTDLEGPLGDDAAANSAMARIVEEASFQREREEFFPFFYYWDSPREMQQDLEEEWSDVIRIEASVWEALGAAWASAAGDARVRLRVKMLITRYRRRD